jgi:uncharacterized membrane protein YesL
MKYDPSPITIKVIKWSIRSWWDELTTLAVVNMAVVLCWITIVLGPPATMGMVYLSHALVNGESLGLSGLVEGGRKYFWKGWLWALLNLFVGVILWSNMVFYSQLDIIWLQGVPLMMVILGIVWIILQFYTLPFLMLQEDKSLKNALRNAYVISALNPGYTLVIFSFALLVVVLSVLIMLPLFLGALPLLSILGVQATRDRVDDYKKRQKKQQEESKKDK